MFSIKIGIDIYQVIIKYIYKYIYIGIIYYGLHKYSIINDYSLLKYIIKYIITN